MKYLLLFLVLPFISYSQLKPEKIKIPMRDGKTLAADLYLPSSRSLKPVILIQTPYNKLGFRKGLPLGILRDIESSPYIFVVADWRCFYGSLLACKAKVNRGEDGYDAVEWLAQQSWCNGKVATWGPSALGNIQFETAKEQPPSLVCAVPLVASPRTSYHQYYANGSARTAYIESIQRLFGNGLKLVVQNPYYNRLWSSVESMTHYPEDIHVPMLMIGGWFDHNTDDNLFTFNELRKNSPVAKQHRLLMGPWVHGGVGSAKPGAEIQGDLAFPKAVNYPNIIANQFLAYHLLGAKNGWPLTDNIQYFQMGKDTWQTSSVFPPASITKEKTLFLTDSNKLYRAPLSFNPGQQSWQYDPTDPSPTIGGKTLHPDLVQGPVDQSKEVENRDDVLVFTSDVLREDVEIKGQIKVILHISSDQKDTDIALRLTEVYPDGKSILLGDNIQRMRFRNGFMQADEIFMTEGEIYEIEIKFDHLAQTFKKGNKIRLIITSSNYPKYNRNMNTGDEMYPDDNIDTLINPIIATNSIHFNTRYLSKIVFPIEKPSATIIDITSTMKIYPNPVTKTLKIDNIEKNKSIEIYALTGQLIQKITPSNQAIEIDVAGYKNGIYFIKTIDGKYYKFVKQ